MGYNASADINPATLLLEGLYTPSGPTYSFGNGTKLFVPFAGSDVVAAIASKLPLHLGTFAPGTYEVFLHITGNLYSGMPFTATGKIDVTVDPLPSP